MEGLDCLNAMRNYSNNLVIIEIEMKYESGFMQVSAKLHTNLCSSLLNIRKMFTYFPVLKLVI